MTLTVWARRPRSRGLLIGAALSLALPLMFQLSQPESPYRYPFTQPVRQDITGQLEQSLAFYRTRIQQTPADGLSRAALATVYLKLAQATGDANWYLLAEQAAAQSLANLPHDNAEALLALANVAEATHDFDRAIAQAQQVLEAQPQHEGALAILVTAQLGKGHIAQAEIAAKQLSQQLPSLGSAALRALVQVAKGEDAAALQTFQTALAAEEPEEAGSSAWVRTLMAQVYADRGELAQAEQLYQEALRILPRYPLALTRLAQLETRRGHYRAAIRHYQQVFISRDYPNVWDHVALQGLAQVEQLRGHRAAAETLWQQAEDLFRQHQDLSTFGHRRELARLLLARDHAADLPEALALMEADLQVRRDVETLDTYAWVLTRLGRWQAAQAVLAEAIATGRRSAVIYARASGVAQQLGQTDRANAYRQQAQMIDPTFGPRDRQIWGLNL
ncbi:MAG: tetratricopeptide repeat protein [Leptolyngbya sp. SIO4C1]|nr:tetratricopeptide repeat protein [Leptolyngbya sp. SIO4C1]